MSEIPNYVPAHKLPCWLSSEDVKAAIVALANTGADKAVCWDMTQAIYGLCENAKPAAHIHPCGHCGKLECDGDCQPVLPEIEGSVCEKHPGPEHGGRYTQLRAAVAAAESYFANNPRDDEVADSLYAQMHAALATSPARNTSQIGEG